MEEEEKEEKVLKINDFKLDFGISEAKLGISNSLGSGLFNTGRNRNHPKEEKPKPRVIDKQAKPKINSRQRPKIMRRY